MTDDPQSPIWQPIATLADLDSLDDAEWHEGYFDGCEDAPEPRPGGNRSRAYWHGWRVRMMDANRLQADEVHQKLVSDFLAREKARRVAQRKKGSAP